MQCSVKRYSERGGSKTLKARGNIVSKNFLVDLKRPHGELSLYFAVTVQFNSTEFILYSIKIKPSHLFVACRTVLS